MLDVPDTYVGGIDEVHVDRTGRFLEIKLNQTQPDNTRTPIYDLQTGTMTILNDQGFGSRIGYDAWAGTAFTCAATAIHITAGDVRFQPSRWHARLVARLSHFDERAGSKLGNG